MWRTRLLLCALLLAAGLALRFAVGGQPFAAARDWYAQQLRNSILPEKQVDGLRKQVLALFPPPSQPPAAASAAPSKAADSRSPSSAKPKASAAPASTPPPSAP